MRPGCPTPARASLSFRYGTREAWLERLSDEPRPESYDLCGSHAARTRPPHGWQLRDRRPREEQVDAEPPTPPDGLGGEQTVAVLAAALRSVPSDVSADVEAPVDVDTVAEVDAPEVPEPDAEDPTSTGAGAGRLEDTTSPVLEPPPTDTADAGDPGRERVPRPVPAARERFGAEHDRAPGGPARHW